jgi:hypothetical protein
MDIVLYLIKPTTKRNQTNRNQPNRNHQVLMAAEEAALEGESRMAALQQQPNQQPTQTNNRTKPKKPKPKKPKSTEPKPPGADGSRGGCPGRRPPHGRAAATPKPITNPSLDPSQQPNETKEAETNRTETTRR